MNFDYRLVEHYYRNSIQWEDGPGSLQNIVSKKRSRVVREWTSRNEVFEGNLLTHGLQGLELSSADGWEEYLYELQRRSSVGGDWNYIGFVRAVPDSTEY